MLSLIITYIYTTYTLSTPGADTMSFGYVILSV